MIQHPSGSFSRLATAEDAEFVVKQLALTGQYWLPQAAEQALADRDRMLVIHEDKAHTPDGVYMLKRTPAASYLGPVSPSPREPGRLLTVLEMAAYLCFEARKKWPTDFKAGRVLRTPITKGEPQAQLQGALTTAMSNVGEHGAMDNFSIDLLDAERKLQQFLPPELRRAA